MSSAANPVVDSPVLNANAIAAVLVEAEFDTVLELMVTPGAVPSYVHVYVLDTVLVLPAPSAYPPAATDTVGEPSLEVVHVAV